MQQILYHLSHQESSSCQKHKAKQNRRKEKGLLAGRIHEDLTEWGKLSQTWKGHSISLGSDEEEVK